MKEIKWVYETKFFMSAKTNFFKKNRIYKNFFKLITLTVINDFPD